MSVIDRLAALVSGGASAPEPKPLPPADVPHVLAALLVRIAKADNHYAFQEISQIDRVLAHFLDIGPIDAAKLRGESERLEGFAPDTDDFALMLGKMVPYADRLAMTRALWQVVFADGATRQAELEAMTVTQQHLGINPEDCEDMRVQARDALSASS